MLYVKYAAQFVNLNHEDIIYFLICVLNKEIGQILTTAIGTTGFVIPHKAGEFILLQSQERVCNFLFCLKKYQPPNARRIKRAAKIINDCCDVFCVNAIGEVSPIITSPAQY